MISATCLDDMVLCSVVDTDFIDNCIGNERNAKISDKRNWLALISIVNFYYF